MMTRFANTGKHKYSELKMFSAPLQFHPHLSVIIFAFFSSLKRQASMSEVHVEPYTSSVQAV